jgi:murein DD-endopeptidase MepM/ murein hydrolase activator NlpD
MDERRYKKAFAVLALLAVAGAALALTLPPKEYPDTGRVSPIYAAAAERLDVHTLARGETLGELLARSTLESGAVNEFLLAFREHASPRRLRAGVEVSFRWLGEGHLRGIDVTLNPDETVRLTRRGSGWQSTVVETPIYTDTVFASGEIETVLWNAVVGNPGLHDLPAGDRAQIIHYLDQVFQWQIDFSRQIQAGDTYRFAFERQVRPDGSMRSGHVLAAELVNQGKAFHALWFDPNEDGKGTYYDLDGESVRRAFLRKPLEFRRISSRFSGGRYHPVLKRWRAHRGIDYAANSGTPVMATGEGVVQRRENAGSCGNMIQIRHSMGFVTKYCHLRRFAKDVHVGTRVAQGQVIGQVGMTGLATGPHLHYEMIRHGSHVDPMAIELPGGDPVPTEAWSRWAGQMAPRLDLLNRMVDPLATLESTRIADDTDEIDG